MLGMMVYGLQNGKADPFEDKKIRMIGWGSKISKIDTTIFYSYRDNRT